MKPLTIFIDIFQDLGLTFKGDIFQDLGLTFKGEIFNGHFKNKDIDHFQ